MQPTIELENAMEQHRRGGLLVDVRSPAEFAETTIPGAVNIPIFDDQERARVGTCFKQQGKAEARRLGIELAAPKIPAMIARLEALRKPGMPPVVVFCWRGGMRSLAMTSFFNLAGIASRQLVGGHKSFRSMVNAYFEKVDWPPVLVLRGLTGVGKTQLLQLLSRENFPVIDLEGLANHRGSAFGALGLEPQPGQKMFEALLWDRLQQLSASDYLLTEGESRRIGRLSIPPRFHAAMQEQTSIWIESSLEFRIKIILQDYPALDDLRDSFRDPILALKEKLGGAVTEKMLEMLEQGQWHELTRELMVSYYDPLYLHTLPRKRLEIQVDSLEEGLLKVREAVRTIRNGLV